MNVDFNDEWIRRKIGKKGQVDLEIIFKIFMGS
jgi:hypothetical protein